MTISIDIERTVEEAIKNIAYVAIFFITLYCCHSIERQRALLISIALVATLLSIWVTSTAVVGLVNDGSYTHVTGSFVNKNHFAAFLNMGIAAAVGIILSAGLSERRSENRQGVSSFIVARLMDWRWHMVVYLSVLIITLLFSMSRGAWMALIMSMLIVLVVIHNSKHNREWSFSTFVMLISVVGLTMLLAGGEVLIQRMSELGQDAVSRQGIWKITVAIIKDFPLFGVGAGNYQYIYPSYDNGVVSSYVDHAHNDYLQLLAEQGVVSVMLLGLVIIRCLGSAVKTIRYSHNMISSAFAASALLGCSVMLLHGIVDFNFYIPSNAVYFFVFLAMAHMAGFPAHSEAHRSRYRRSADRRVKSVRQATLGS